MTTFILHRVLASALFFSIGLLGILSAQPTFSALLLSMATIAINLQAAKPARI